jgi:hypothetical protein
MPSWKRARKRRWRAALISASEMRFLVDGIDESGIGLALAVAAFEVGAGFDGGGGGVGHVGRVSDGR